MGEGSGALILTSASGEQGGLGGLTPTHLSNPRVGPGDIKMHRTLQPRREDRLLSCRCFCSRSRNTCCWSLAPRGHSTEHWDE